MTDMRRLALLAALACVAHTFAATVQIAANGGEIPDSPDAIVSISSAGSGTGGITLASGVTDATIKSLEQNSATPATVNIAAGQTLAVSGTLSFANGATLAVDDPDRLAAGKYTLVESGELVMGTNTKGGILYFPGK